MTRYPPTITFATALRDLPSCFRGAIDGRIYLLAVAFAYGYNDPIFGSKRCLVSVAIAANMSIAENWGKGTNAKRRIARMERAYEDAQDALADQLVEAEELRIWH